MKIFNLGFDEQTIIKELLAHPSVEDCTVLKDLKTEQELYIYVVLAGKFAPEQLHLYLTNALRNRNLPKANFIAISRIPLTTQGKVDKKALMQFPIIDADLEQNWENKVLSQPEVEEAAVVIQEQKKEIPSLHLLDLLTNKTPKKKENTAKEKKSLEVSKKLISNPPAITHGDTLLQKPGAPKVLSEILQRAAQQPCQTGVTYISADGREVLQSYQALVIQTEQILRGLRKQGLKPQDKVIFQFDNNQDFIPTFWACILGGFVPIPISPIPSYELSNNIVRKLYQACQLFEPSLILTTDKVLPKLRSLLEKLELKTSQVECIETLREVERDSNWYEADPEDLAVLLLTSGSTGEPKGVMLKHSNLLSSVAGTSAKDSFNSSDISLNWLPLDHPGPLIRCVIRPMYLGAQQLHAPISAVLSNPLKWLDWLEHYRVTITWAPNFAYALLSDRALEIKEGSWDLSSVRCFLNTAEPIVPDLAKKVLKLLEPHGLSPDAMNSSWGMAETSSGVTSSYQYLEATKTLPNETFAELGSPIPGISLRIVNEQSEVVEEEIIGYLQVKGITITSGYYQNPQANAQSFTEDGWFKTGDLGFLKAGRLTITGRSKDIIIINGNNYYSHEIEAAVEVIEGVEVSYTAACAIRQPASNTDQLVVFFHTAFKDDYLAQLIKEIQRNVVSKVGVSPSYLIPVDKEVIPKTSIGKIQRSQLKQRFEKGEFAEITKRIDLLLGNDNTLPDWFYRKVWRPKQATIVTNKPPSQALIFLDSLGLGEALLHSLGDQGIGVEAGTEFAKLADNRYSIDLQNPDHYEQLLSSTDPQALANIVHLWTYQEKVEPIDSLEALEQSQNCGSFSLLLLTQALAKINTSGSSVRLGIISSHSQLCNPEEEIAYQHSPIFSIAKTLPREIPWLDCVHIDLPVAAIEEHSEYIWQELSALPREREIVYRDGMRLVPYLEAAHLPQQPKTELPFQEGQMIVISGGLGGVGTEIARYLLENYQARLLLLGRNPLPKRSTWNEHLQKGDKLAQRLQTYLDLEQLGGEFDYAAVDLCNLEQMRALVKQAEQRWECSLAGVIHLAGVAPERLLLEETRVSFTATVRPKVFGAWTLHQLLKDKPGSYFISFSSIISFFGGATVGAYGAANSFLDSFAQYQRKQHLRSYCFSSSTWDDLGVSQGYQGKENTRAQGHYAMSIEQGLSSLLASLHCDQVHILVGIDGSHANIRHQATLPSYQTQKLKAYYTAQTNLIDQLQKLEVGDRFGRKSTCEFQKLEEMPLTATGTIDREKLAAGLNADAEKIAPRNQTESQLAQIWQKVLGVKDLGVRDNFFALGGQSLLAISLFAEIEETFCQKLPLATLFEAPTIEQLAEILAPSSEQTTPSDSLVLINSGGSEPPLFLVHDADGETMLYLNLARHLPERSVYGLQPCAKVGYPLVHTRFEEMVNYYIEKIRTVQPHGPYLLGGLCAGGVLAFAIATELQGQGEDVPFVALIDSLDVAAPPQVGRIASQRFRRFSQTLTQHQKKGWKRLFFAASQVRQKVSNLVMYESKTKFEQVQDIFKLRLYRYCLDRQLPLPRFLQNLSVRKLYKFAKQSYVPGVFQGRLVVYRATEGEGTEEPAINITSDPFLGWEKRATEGVEVYDVSGSHSSMLQEPYVKVLAQQLKSSLQ